MRICEHSWNKPPKRYTFTVDDQAGNWGDVEVSAHDIESAKRTAHVGLLKLSHSALRVGFRLLLKRVTPIQL